MRRNPMKNSNRRIKYVLCTFFSFLFLLIVKLFFLQIFPTEEVISQYTNNQSEVVMDQRYQVFDVNNKDLVNYKINYIVVFDNKPFQLNNYNGNLEELLTLNYIMKEEYSDFNFTDVIKNIGKTYYKISEESYNKISKLLNLKGVYLYTSKEADIQRFYNIGNYIMSIDQSKDYESGTLEAHIKDIMKENDFPRRDFVLNNDSTYKDDGINNIDSNKNIRLTIDKSIEEKITKVLKREEFKDIKNAGVILLESKTGKVKAMVQKNNDEANVNLCVNAMGYEPGSIYKLITLGVAL
ncbi:MAG: penicillin-binding protein 2, partial [Clostridium sp.]|nr:penicillin-binding protein 2 [Clostridium sp.]